MHRLRNRWHASAKRSALHALVGATMLLPFGAGAATPETFQVKTTADLLTLCTTDPAAPDYAMAVSFCHGFAVGAYQYHLQVTKASPAARFVCPPDPPPTRTQAITAFVEWMKAHPELNDSLPVDAMFRFLGERFPCRS